MKQLFEKLSLYGFRKTCLYTLAEIRLFFSRLFLNSYSQHGEDIIIDKLLKNKRKGFYVDVGASDPIRFSNTKRFYDKGWRGINIEPDLNNYQKFVQNRPKDTNINMGMANQKNQLTFYHFLPDTLSTFSRTEADHYQRQGFKLIGKKMVPVDCLKNILNQYAADKTIDFISIDTEGFDLQVLQGNDWQKYKPSCVCIESATHTSNGMGNNKEDGHQEFLEAHGYQKVHDNGLNSIYIDESLAETKDTVT